MKKIRTLLLTIILLFVLSSVTVYAHPGKTDAQGGHYDHQNGGYHYHHGYPEHQHSNGLCPYNYEDNTDSTQHSDASKLSVGDIILVFLLSLGTALVPSFILLLFGIPLPKSISNRLTDTGYRRLFVFLYFVFVILFFIWFT